MNIIEAVTSCLRNYANFTGRAVRSEYWYWYLASGVVSVVFAVVDAWLNPGTQFGLFSAVTAVVTIALTIPGVAVSARRLHDVDRSGWWMLIAFTVVGVVPLLYWACSRGTAGANRFGGDPLAGAAGPKLRKRVAAA